MMNLKEAILKIRFELGKSDQEISDLLGVTKPLVFKFRKGTVHSTSPSNAKKIADILGLQYSEENGAPQFIKIPDKESSQPGISTNYEEILSRYAETLGYEVSPEGVNLFLRECEGKYRTIHKIRNLLSDNENMGKSEANSK